MIRYWMTVLTCVVVLVMPGIPAGLWVLVRPSRRLVAFVSVWWAKAILAAAGVELSIHGRERVADGEPRFYLANHRAAIDTPILIAALHGEVRFLAKDVLFGMPLFGWILRRFEHIRVDRGSARMSLRRIEGALDRLQRDPISIAAYPEGTRSRTGKLLPFRRGTMKICQRAGLTVTPVCIEGSGRVNPPSERVGNPGPVRVTFGRPIPAAEVARLSAEELHDRVRSAIASMLESSESHVPVDAPSSPLRSQCEARRDQQAAACS
jgi:1-acyl-sn-glycerol-3-phosphate acyltransferase